ncbi:hypothetical protein KFK09_015084 [Dendrobium nobile]|uniref:Uncharacterized protein n=1 Tax=Dendrobium nobile TaxID=94219 RepID=A0A8T3B9K3_DENNO|nr:hypothetical protein KFK09_015084 [Dendrobium nobile]
MRKQHKSLKKSCSRENIFSNYLPSSGKPPAIDEEDSLKWFLAFTFNMESASAAPKFPPPLRFHLGQLSYCFLKQLSSTTNKNFVLKSCFKKQQESRPKRSLI